MEKWKILDKKLLLKSPLFKFYAYNLRHSVKNSDHKFYILETNDWVNIVPITPDNQLVLIKQYRAGIDQITVEIPGGIIDEGEEPITAAKRELEEETGYVAEKFELLGFVHPNPAFLTNKCYFVLAKDVKHLGRTNFDPSEYIETFTVPVEQIPELIANQTITHALAVGALLLFWQKYKS